MKKTGVKRKMFKTRASGASWVNTEQVLNTFSSPCFGIIPTDTVKRWSLYCTEAEFLDVIGTKVLRLFLFVIYSHLYKHIWNSQDYLTCTIMNSASGLEYTVQFTSSIDDSLNCVRHHSRQLRDELSLSNLTLWISMAALASYLHHRLRTTPALNAPPYFF